MVATFYLEYWPVVYAKFDNSEITDESFETYKKNYLNLLIKCKNNKEKILFICDLNSAQSMPLNYIMKYSQFNKEIEKFNKEYVICACIMCKNKAFKNLLNLYFSMSKPAAPFKIFRSTEKANKYIKDKFNYNFDINKFYIFNENNEDEQDEEQSDEQDEEQDEEQELNQCPQIPIK
jgi:hypothetical protein